MKFLKNIGQLLLGLLIALIASTLGMVFLAFTPDGFRLIAGFLLFCAAIVFAVFLWKRFRLLFWGCVLLPVLYIVIPLLLVIFVKVNDIKTSPAELAKQGANFSYDKLSFLGVWTAHVPEGGIFEFTHPAYFGRREVKVSGQLFRYVIEERYTEKDSWGRKFTAIYDGKAVYRDPDPLKNPDAVGPWLRDSQYWRDIWEFHPKGFLSRTKDSKIIAGREAVKFETKGLFGPKNIYWVDSATGVVLKDENGYECREIIYAPVGEEIFQKP